MDPADRSGVGLAARGNRRGGRRRCKEGKRRCALLMQRGAYLAKLLGGSRRQRLCRVVKAGDRAEACAHRGPVVMPTEQDSLEQHRRDAEQRDPAPRLSCRATPGLAHGPSVAPEGTSRRRHSWVALTKLVTPTPSTANTRSRNGSPSVSRLWIC